MMRGLAGIFVVMLVGFVPLAGGCAPVPGTDGIVWGVVMNEDHPDRHSSPYNRISLDQQMRLVKTTNFKAIRTGCVESNCEEIVKLAEKYNLLFLRALSLWPGPDASEEDNYSAGFNAAYKAVKPYKGRIRYYEAGNELDNWVGMNGHGDDIAQYNRAKYVRAREMLRGAIAGIRSADPEAKVLVNDAGWCHYGFLKELWKDGIRWDITAMHWYETQGDMEKAGCYASNAIGVHASFGKPIWITEFNSDKSAKAGDGQGAAQWLAHFIARVKELAPKYTIEAAFAFELYDQPQWAGGESRYGMADKNGRLKDEIRQTIPGLLNGEEQ